MRRIMSIHREQLASPLVLWSSEDVNTSWEHLALHHVNVKSNLLNGKDVCAWRKRTMYV